jgi:HAD superfamily hydrolase (TIGR01509 family)
VTGALRAVLFDLDGLLVDSEPLWFEVERAVMARLGGQWGPGDQEALIGGSLDRTVAYVLAKAGRPPPGGPGQVARWLLDGMTELMLARGVPVQPGARELLAEVAAAGIPYALVTSSARQIMDAALAVTGMSFPVTVCGEDVRRTKPDPEPYLLAAARLGVPTAGCVVLEDSPNGVAAARAAGCAVIAVPSVPIPPGSGFVTAKSLTVVDLAMLADLAGSNSDGSGRAVTEKF